MPAHVEIDAAELIVAPGSEEVLEARLRNLGAVTDTFSVAAAGSAQGWVVVDPPLVTLFPGAEQTVRVLLRPPRSASVPAGETTLGLRVVPHGDPDDITSCETVVRILAFDDRRVSFVQPVVRARERATFDLVVENDGNTRATCRLSLVDPANRVGARFEPPSVAVEPGGREVVRMRVAARQPRLAGQPLAHLVTVKASEDGHASAQASATFLQAALLPERLGRRLIGVALAGGLLVAGWFAVVRPAVDRAADEAARQAADEQIAALRAELEPVLAPSTTVPVDEPAGQADGGTPFDRQWSLNATQGQTLQTEPLTVPEGHRFQLSDVFWSNESQDAGSLTLLRDGDVVGRWALGSNRNWSTAWRTPIVVEPGSNVAVQLVCETPGDPTSTNCEVSFTLVGADVELKR